MKSVDELLREALGNQRAGELARAELLYRQVLQAEPAHVGALQLLGMLLFGQKRLEDAAECYRKVVRLDPNDADALNNLGAVLKHQGYVAEAIVCYRQALAARPNFADALSNLGAALKSEGKLTEAISCYQQALQLDPGLAGAHFNLGNALAQVGQFDQAAQSFRQALRVNPRDANTHNNLGNALKDAGQLDEAAACYQQALQLDKDHAQAHNNLGLVLLGQGKLAQARQCFQQALAIHPGYANAHNNLGNVLVEQKELAQADASFGQAALLDPSHKGALWNRSVLRLMQGDLEAGWPDYELRWAQPGIEPRPFKEPRWDGSSLAGKTILIYAEQGLGDTIQFARLLPLVKKRGGTVLLECQRALLELLSGLLGVDQLIPAGASLPRFDAQAPMLSIPGLCGITLANIPAPISYLAADTRLVETWKKRLGAKGDRLNVGIAWQGSMNQKLEPVRSAGSASAKQQGDRRSLSLHHFEPLARVPGVQLVSLQVGPGSEQLAAAAFAVTDLGSRFDTSSLNDLAAALMHMDLVVTVDTAVAHLAGAMGFGCPKSLQGLSHS